MMPSIIQDSDDEDDILGLPDVEQALLQEENGDHDVQGGGQQPGASNTGSGSKSSEGQHQRRRYRS